MKPPNIGQNRIARLATNSCQNGPTPPVNTNATTVIIVISPKVKNVRNVSGFMPVMYALRYGMYIDPNISPAPTAAAIPRGALPCTPSDVEAAEINIAPMKITTAPPTTPAFRSHPDPCSSLNSSVPHRIPIRLLEFQSGNARLSPMSRTAKMVNVLPTAHRQPAITPHSTRCGTCRASRKVSPVPRINAGRLQRDTKAPRTIMKEITIGDTATVTSFVGASAPASQSAAARPQKIPSRWSTLCRDWSRGVLSMAWLNTGAFLVIELSGAAAIQSEERRVEPRIERHGKLRSTKVHVAPKILLCAGLAWWELYAVTGPN